MRRLSSLAISSAAKFLRDLCVQSLLALHRQRAEEFVEVRGERLVQGEEPDCGFVLLAELAVEPLEDLLGRFGRAEHLVERGGADSFNKI